MNAGAPRRVRFQQQQQQRKAQDDMDENAEMASLRLHPVLQWDLELVAWVVHMRETSPLLESLIISTTSRSRTQDISLLLWLIFFAMLPDFGLPYMWICVGNLLTVLLLQYVAQVLRPIDIDLSLPRLPTCTDPDTNGFPCVDCHMSIVVLLPVIEHTQSHVARLAFSLIGLYIAGTRLALGSRFLSQIFGSWLTGLTGIAMGNHGHLAVKTYKLTSGYNTAAIISLAAFLMVVVGHWVENNESRLLGVPKTDFMDVLGNILGSDGAPTSTSTSTPEQEQEVARIHQLPQRSSTRYRDDQDDDDDNSSTSSSHELLGKKDSFYYLMKGMQTRAQHKTPQNPPLTPAPRMY